MHNGVPIGDISSHEGATFHSKLAIFQNFPL